MTQRKVIDLTQLANASLDAETLAEAMNGDENTDVTSRLGRKYPTLAKLLKTIENTSRQKLRRADSISTLRSMTAEVEGERVIVDAYYANGEFGGGEFVSVSGGGTADDGGLIIVGAGGTVWSRVITGDHVSLHDFGVIADGKTDTTVQINQALRSCAGRYIVTAPAGTIIFSSEIKLPSHLVLKGVGIDKTIFKASRSLPAIANGMTNASNNYERRNEYDSSIHISDFTLDHNHKGRYSIGAGINNQACGIKFSAVRGGTINRVKVINAVLHCFDIAADQYVATGNVTDNATNMSMDIGIADCIAVDPYRDDCFTTHNSQNITIERCLAEHTGNVTPLGNTQQGFEVDEGSEYVTIKNCRAVNLYCGYQSKGHEGTKPAQGVTFSDCIADGCAYGFMASIGTNLQGKSGYVGQAVSFVNCTVNNPVRRLSTDPVAAYIYGADGVSIDGLTINGDARILITAGARRVSLRNIIFNTALTRGEGCIESDPNTSVFLVIDNASSVVQQTIPMVAKLSSGAILKAKNLYMRGASGNAIKLSRNAQDSITDAWNWGYAGTVYLVTEGYALTGTVEMTPHNQVTLFGRPNAQLKAPQSTRILTGAEAWVQASSDGNTPDWRKIY